MAHPGRVFQVEGYAVRQGGYGLSMVSWVLEGAYEETIEEAQEKWHVLDERTRSSTPHDRSGLSTPSPKIESVLQAG